jgi:hypothetical protein
MQQGARQLTWACKPPAMHAAPQDDMRRSAGYTPPYGAPPPGQFGAPPHGQFGAPPPPYGPSPSFKQSSPSAMPGTVPGIPMAPPNDVRGDDCECSCGWTLFGLGFVFPILWLFGICRGCDSDVKDPNEKRAAKACTIAFLIYIPIWIVVIVLTGGQRGSGRLIG